MADLTVLNEQRWGRLDAALYDLKTWSPHFFKWARTGKLLHAHMGPTGVHALLASRRLGLPLVMSYYGFDVTLLASSDRFRRPFWHYALRHEALFQQADRILFLSEHMKRAPLDGGRAGGLDGRARGREEGLRRRAARVCFGARRGL